MYLIYSLTFPNNKVYIGITTDFKRRMSQHKHSSKKRNLKLYNAIRKYGWENIKKEIISKGYTLEEINLLEIEYIVMYDSINNGYNLSPGGHIPNINQSEIMKEWMKDPEVKNKAITALHSNELQRLESLRTDEFRKLVSDRNKRLIKEGKSKLPILKKKVICNETGEIWDSITECAKSLNGQRTHLRAHIKGDRYRPRFKGLTFKLLEVSHFGIK